MSRATARAVNNAYHMSPEARADAETPVYTVKLDIFSFGTLIIHTFVRKAPDVHEIPLYKKVLKLVPDGKIELTRRHRAIQQLGLHHCAYPLVVHCLHDDPDHRPTAGEVCGAMGILWVDQAEPVAQTMMAEAKQQLKTDLEDIGTEEKEKGTTNTCAVVQREESIAKESKESLNNLDINVVKGDQMQQSESEQVEGSHCPGVLQSSESSAAEVCKRKSKYSIPMHEGRSKAVVQFLKVVLLNKKPDVHWAEIAGLHAAKNTFANKEILSTFKAILLYGPTGTGKTFLAKAMATEVDATFFSVSPSDLVCVWQSESPYLVRSLFEEARTKKPAIIFIDELDWLYSVNSDSKSAAHQIRTELVSQINKMEDTGVLVLGATNIPWLLDQSITQAFQRRIFTPLLKKEDRKHLFQLHVGPFPHSLIQSDWETLASRTEGYSGADIEKVIKEALMMPVRKIQYATHFKKVSGPSPADPSILCDDFFAPCGPWEFGAVEMSLSDVPYDKVLEPKVTIADFQEHLEKIKPTVSRSDLKKFEAYIADNWKAYKESFLCIR